MSGNARLGAGGWHRTRAAVLLLAVLASLPAAAHVTTSSSEHKALAGCAAQTDPDQRLACYDQVAQGLLKPSAQPAATQAPATEEFGMNRAVAERSGTVAKNAIPEAISAAVDKVDKRSNGTLVLVLANGQIWYQRTRDRGLRVKPGDTVTIKRGALGGYRLTARGNKAFKVTRLK